MVLGWGSSASCSAGIERAVDLDDVDVRRARGEVLAEHAQAAADLQHDLPGVELGGALDDAEDVRVDEEVLAEVAARAHAELAHAPQARLGRQLGGSPAEEPRGVGVDDRLELGLGLPAPLRPRSGAVCATSAGWLRSLRTACGVRYGASVSTSRRSSGTRSAAAASSSERG